MVKNKTEELNAERAAEQSGCWHVHLASLRMSNVSVWIGFEMQTVRWPNCQLANWISVWFGLLGRMTYIWVRLRLVLKILSTFRKLAGLFRLLTQKRFTKQPAPPPSHQPLGYQNPVLWLTRQTQTSAVQLSWETMKQVVHDYSRSSSSLFSKGWMRWPGPSQGKMQFLLFLGLGEGNNQMTISYSE